MNYFKISKFFLFASTLSIAIVTSSTLFPFIVGKYAWFRGTVWLAFVLFCLGFVLNHPHSVQYRERLWRILRSPIPISLGIFVLAFLIAGFFGIDPAQSFWSNFERGEGGLQLLTLYVFFILALTLFRTDRAWRVALWTVIGGALAMTLYGVFAGTGISGFIGPKFSEVGYRFQGSIGNPAYVAAYALFAVMYALYLWVTAEGRRLWSPARITALVSGLMLLTVFFLAATRGTFVGLLVALVVGVGYIAWHRKSMRRWLMGGVAIILVLVGVSVYFKQSPLIQSLPIARVFDLSFSTRTFGDRAIMWKIAVDGFQERPILGWGPENFIQVFDRHFNTDYYQPPEQFGAWFDRAHSVFFDYLVEIGIVGLLSYLAVFVMFYRTLWRSAAPDGMRATVARAIIFAFPVAYLVQGIVLFDVFPIYFNVFLFLAFSTHTFFELQNIKQKGAVINT
jgi:O-antigen ligase